MKEICKLAAEKGFKQWFSDYSEKYHHLDGWIDYDQYLDEVELPEELVLTLIQNWLRKELDVHIEVTSHKYKIKELKSIPRSYKYNNTGNYSSYFEALKAGIKETLKDGKERI